MNPLIDPVTLDVFDMPVLASDGYTYSLSTLQQCVQADPWHRSPVTCEVLRPWVYPNAFVASYLDVPPGEACELFEACGPETIADMPADGELRVLHLPVRADTDRARARCTVGLPADSVSTLTVRTVRTHTGLVLQHPPCPNNMQDLYLAMAKAFCLVGEVANPKCLSTAVVASAPSIPAQTVEQYFLAQAASNAGDTLISWG